MPVNALKTCVPRQAERRLRRTDTAIYCLFFLLGALRERLASRGRSGRSPLLRVSLSNAAGLDRSRFGSELFALLLSMNPANRFYKFHREVVVTLKAVEKHLLPML